MIWPYLRRPQTDEAWAMQRACIRAADRLRDEELERQPEPWRDPDFVHEGVRKTSAEEVQRLRPIARRSIAERSKATVEKSHQQIHAEVLPCQS